MDHIHFPASHSSSSGEYKDWCYVQPTSWETIRLWMLVLSKVVWPFSPRTPCRALSRPPQKGRTRPKNLRSHKWGRDRAKVSDNFFDRTFCSNRQSILSFTNGHDCRSDNWAIPSWWDKNCVPIWMDLVLSSNATKNMILPQLTNTYLSTSMHEVQWIRHETAIFK